MPTRRRATRLILLVAALAAATPVTLAQEGGIYKSRDAQGNVIFSDKAPDEKAEAVKLPRTNTMPEVAPPTARPDQAGQDTATGGYDTLAIVTPTDGQAVINPGGSVDVSISVTPPLQTGHSLRLLLDGQPAGIPQQGALTLEGLGQGAHTLQANVVDADGQVLQSSSTVTVQVQRAGGRRIGPVRIP